MISRSVSAKIANMGIVCAFLVVSIHVKWPPDTGSVANEIVRVLVQHVARYAVPFFFGVSGYLLAGRFDEPGWWWRAVRRRIVTLGVPFVIWSVLFLLAMACVDVVANLLAGREPLSAMRGAWGSVRIFMGMNLFHLPGLVPLWYVRNLLLLVAISPLLKAMVHRLDWWSVGGLALVYVAYGVVAETGMVPERLCLLLNYGFSVEGLLCFVVGIVLRRRGCDALSGVGVGTSCVAWLASLALSLAIEGRIPACCFAARSLCMAATLLFVWKVVPDVPWPTWLTASAFPVFLLHCFVLDACRLIPRLSASAAGACLQTLSELLAACLLPIAFTRLVGHCAPRLSGVLFGGR